MFKYLFKKERFALLKHTIAIPLGRKILCTKSRDKMATGNNRVKCDNFRNRSMVAFTARN